jgi:hypothetical protein
LPLTRAVALIWSSIHAVGVRRGWGIVGVFMTRCTRLCLLVDEVVGDGAVVDGVGCGDVGVPTVAAGLSGACGFRGGVLLASMSLARSFVEVSVAPGGGHACPVGAVGSWAGGRDDDGQVLTQGRHVVWDLGAVVRGSVNDVGP